MFAATANLVFRTWAIRPSVRSESANIYRCSRDSTISACFFSPPLHFLHSSTSLYLSTDLEASALASVIHSCDRTLHGNRRSRNSRVRVKIVSGISGNSRGRQPRTSCFLPFLPRFGKIIDALSWFRTATSDAQSPLCRARNLHIGDKKKFTPSRKHSRLIKANSFYLLFI